MPFNLLIVDDSETVRSVISKTLELSGLDLGLYYAANGRQALDVLHEHWIDLVFTDLNMPVMTGMELIETMRREAMLEKTSVVVVSAEGSQTRIDDLLARGVQACLHKPFTPEKLRALVEDLLGIEHDEIKTRYDRR
ncbi:MAG: response regulator [Candidatus Hydrogenedentes bacterium]|nr:response regulator [Candidatus Hydrogenedentota bacterium]